MKTRVTAALALALFELACSKEVPAPLEAPRREPVPTATLLPTAATSAAPAAASAPAASAAAPADPCAAIAARFEVARREGDASCASAADCACFSCLKVDGTIEVASAKLASKLQAIVDEYHAAKCPTICVQPATPPVCKPSWAAGQCR